MYETLRTLFPIHRSLLGDGVNESIEILLHDFPERVFLDFPSGSQVFSWTVPKEWHLRNAYIEFEDGTKICSISETNLRVVQYSEPIDRWVTLDELKEIIHVHPVELDAIPYVTSYYQTQTGFCLTATELANLKPGLYHIVIDSEFQDGALRVAEVVFPGESKKEIMFSSYLCHPSMANNELSGPVVLAELARCIRKRKNYYTYRFVFGSETLGALAYISVMQSHLTTFLKAGFVATCLGGPGDFSAVLTRSSTSWVNQVITCILSSTARIKHVFGYMDRDSDERQYAAGIPNLPVVGLSKTKPGTFREYHTSLDDLTHVTEEQLNQSLNLLVHLYTELEGNTALRLKPKQTTVGEPFLQRFGLYPTLSTGSISEFSRRQAAAREIIGFSDGEHSLAYIAYLIGQTPQYVTEVARELVALALIELEEG